MRSNYALLLVAAVTCTVCGALSVETSASSVKLSNAVPLDYVPSDAWLNADSQKRSLRSHDAEEEERQVKMLKTLDPKLRTYKTFGNALLKQGEPKKLYKKWNPSKWDKLRGCLQPPCVAP
ncbi:hypothetical protein PC119_g24967 [Phytophthora cactorum]|uniref:RxLR effector protein n=1 Tax=Phytophthora cactorum TaxID=29920 RepID=A0A8T1AF83_9STRA|nr:hypothetical protein PC111_g22734 [Phytophthora cactorum]KAG2794547.1 hypothetical protein PC112_g23000 [Phytophthora cactorum]KAG2818244.1 hypothetical protein PC113_g22879 [Phytophthora cactorum]KAG2873826.1 hypothetical protein PC114_g25637 [Phytophthora cactorum]KAG2879408.1 hypothetical protein PC115_g22811 [Phytophthora cactorum]